MTVEDAAELRLLQRHVVPLESRPPNVEGEGEIRIRDLVRNALRMRPDRIIVGEVRGAESLDMLQAMNTGHDGSLTTIHANSARDALHRLEMLVLMAGDRTADQGRSASRSPAASTSSSTSDGSSTAPAASRRSPRSPAWKATSSRSRISSSLVRRARRGDGSGLLGPLRSTGASARLPVQARRQRRRAAALGVAECRMRRALLAALALGALAAPSAAVAAGSSAVQIRRRRRSTEFPLVRVTAVVPAGQPPDPRRRTAVRPRYVKARELGAAQAMVLAVDNSASMTGRPLREAKRAADGVPRGPAPRRRRRLVAFGHEALSLTAPAALESDVGARAGRPRAGLADGDRPLRRGRRCRSSA